MDRRIHGELVPVRAGKQAGAEEDGAHALARPRRRRRSSRCASRSSARAAFPPVTADSKLSPKSFRSRLAARGHQVSVYCRERHPQTQLPRRASRSTCPPSGTNTSTRSRTRSSRTLHLLTHRVDVALYCNGANAIFTVLPRDCGMPVALNVDGMERKRKKWNRLAKAWYLVSEWLATFCPTVVVTDARDDPATITRSAIGKREHVHSVRRGARQGGDARRCSSSLGWSAGRYFLYVSRHGAGESSRSKCARRSSRCATTMKLALIGDAPYAQEYIRRVRDTQRSAHRDPGRDLRRRAIASWGRTASPTSTRRKSAARIRR